MALSNCFQIYGYVESIMGILKLVLVLGVFIFMCVINDGGRYLSLLLITYPSTLTNSKKKAEFKAKLALDVYFPNTL
jgi:hypothetical protein